MALFKFGGKSREPAAPPSVETLRRRARQRLVGAAILVAAAVVGFPMVFDAAPRPVAVDVPIVVPDKSQVQPLVLPGSSNASSVSAPANPSSAPSTSSSAPPPPGLTSNPAPSPAPAVAPAQAPASAPAAPPAPGYNGSPRREPCGSPCPSTSPTTGPDGEQPEQASCSGGANSPERQGLGAQQAGGSRQVA